MDDENNEPELMNNENLFTLLEADNDKEVETYKANYIIGVVDKIRHDSFLLTKLAKCLMLQNGREFYIKIDDHVYIQCKLKFDDEVDFSKFTDINNFDLNNS